MIRPYTADDREAVLSIWRDASALAHPFLPADKVDDAERMIRDVFLDLAETLIFETDGVAQGFLALIGDEVGGLFVRPGAQGRGIGRALMDQAKTLRPRLELSVFAENPRAKWFYERNGFVAGQTQISDMFGHTETRMTYVPLSVPGSG